MTNEIQESNTTEHKQPAPFGTRLKSAREALGLDRKDAAAQLRLNEKVIIMMEKDRYPHDLPVTFIRGYIRAYGKLLQIPEYEIKKAIEPMKPKQIQHEAAIPAMNKQSAPVTSGNYFMQFFTSLIVITLIALVCVWWYTHTSQPIAPALNIPENQLNTSNSATLPSVVSVESTPSTPAATTASTNAQKIVEGNRATAQQSPPLNQNIAQKKTITNEPAHVSQKKADQETDSDEFDANDDAD